MQITRLLIRITKVIAVLLLSIMFVILWIWVDYSDYFRSDYHDLTEEQITQFRRKDGYDGEGKMLQNAFISQFKNDEYKFPRQQVSEVKLFRNIPAIGIFTGHKLNQKQMDFILALFNDPSNFDWGETTWPILELENEYVFKFYNHEGTVVGTIDFCMTNCWLTSSRPFSPRMKFGSLNDKGRNKLNAAIQEIRR